MNDDQSTHTPMERGERFHAPHVFVVRIWHEPREIGGAPPLWRGVVEDTDTKECMYFVDMRRLTEFVNGKAGIAECEAVNNAGGLLRRLWHTLTRAGQ